jgi:hypothetical protein
MTDAPVFDRPELFDPRRVRFCDIDGTGAVDVLYLDRGAIRYWLNTAGNGWSVPHVFDQLPEVDNLASIAALDFLGNGTSCVVWSSPAPRDAGRPLAYLDLMGGQKPYPWHRSARTSASRPRSRTHRRRSSTSRIARAGRRG